MATWSIEDATSHLSEVVERARREGPQRIAVAEKEAAVVLSSEVYEALTRGSRNFVAHLLGGPKVEDFDVERDNDTGRAVDLG